MDAPFKSRGFGQPCARYVSAARESSCGADLVPSSEKPSLVIALGILGGAFVAGGTAPGSSPSFKLMNPTLVVLRLAVSVAGRRRRRPLT
jgi:hypothetical protein